MMPPAALQLLAALLEVGPAGAAREHLVQKAGIATSTFYRVIKPLLQQGLLVEEDRRYRMPLDNLHNFRFKLWHDAQRLYELPPADRDAILDLAQRAERHLQHNLRALWLVGSAAHGNFTADSDLDFLAVVTQDTDYHPSGHRPINFVVLTESQLAQRRAAGDDFVLEAVRFGLLLYDAAFARDVYAQPWPVPLSPAQAEDAHHDLERHRQRLLRFVAGEDPEHAMSALRALAIKTSWWMLRTMNVLPPPRADLAAACERYFGPQFAECIARATGRRSLPLPRLVKLARDLHEYQRRFHQHRSHLRAYAPLPSAGGMDMEPLCMSLFCELLPGPALEPPTGSDADADLVVRSDHGRTYLVQCKSSTREITPEQIADLWRHVSPAVTSRTRCVLIANELRDIPALERQPEAFTAAVTRTARQKGIILLTGLQLLQAHNVLHLEELPPQRIVTDLLGTGSPRSKH